MTTVTSIESLRLSRRAALFEGRDEIPVSMFITRYDETLRVVSVHPSPTVQQTDL